ncbi:MAG: polymorphic toxin-type HINT domain-containing protein, partial [Lachnospiraceae bacterium]|nr:polymorphic toxin-type HINT domain-containing protein [Lachnospiraceae bacterium]
YLDLPEMGAVGDAKVIAIEPCPPIKPGKGNVITGTFHHEAGQTIDIHVQGLDKPIGCTANHPFWSATRQDFVEAGTLQPQEDLLLYDGQITKVIQILPRPGPERVHNLEVLNEHVYYVENVGLLVHNECIEQKRDSLGRFEGKEGTELRPGSIAEKRAHAIALMFGAREVYEQVTLISSHPELEGKHRRMDLVVKLDDGTYLGIEVKSGGAKRNQFQRKFDDSAGKYTVSGVGPNTNITISKIETWTFNNYE